MIQYILTIRNTDKTLLVQTLRNAEQPAEVGTTWDHQSHTLESSVTKKVWGPKIHGKTHPDFTLWSGRPRVVGWKPRSFSLANTSSHREFQLWWSKVFKMPCHWGRLHPCFIPDSPKTENHWGHQHGIFTLHVSIHPCLSVLQSPCNQLSLAESHGNWWPLAAQTQLSTSLLHGQRFIDHVLGANREGIEIRDHLSDTNGLVVYVVFSTFASKVIYII